LWSNLWQGLASCILCIKVGTGEIRFDGGRIWTRHGWRLGSIPDGLSARFAPARCFAYEWTDYWVSFPHAEGLRVGDGWAEVIGDGLFRVRFGNQVGLARLQPFSQGRPLGEALPLEVQRTWR
jgi:hypothetical protein